MFEDYLDQHFSIDRVSGGRELIVNDACPFCGGSGKIYFNPGKNTGICHKCGKGFRPIRFVMKHQRISYAQAVKILNLGSGYQRSQESESEEDELWFPPASDMLGAPLDYLLSRGVDPLMIHHLGLFYSSQNVKIGDRVFWTKDRIIIPIFDRAGNVVSWQGRDITGLSKLKYLFPPGFKGAEHLYNINRAEKGKMLIVCEGVFDAFGWMRAGFKNVVATFGKKMSGGQLEMIADLQPRVLMLAWDSDALTQKYEFCERYDHLFKAIRIVDLHGKDADELDRNELISALRDSRQYSWEEKITASL